MAKLYHEQFLKIDLSTSVTVTDKEMPP